MVALRSLIELLIAGVVAFSLVGCGAVEENACAPKAGKDHGAGCTPKSYDEWIVEIREKFDCKDAAPCDCPCAMDNRQAQFACTGKGEDTTTDSLWDDANPTWAEGGCIYAYPDKNSEGDMWTDGFEYPQDFGEGCPDKVTTATGHNYWAEVGSYSCAATDQAVAKADAANASIIPFPWETGVMYNNKYDGDKNGDGTIAKADGDTTWCMSKWCYADPCKCNAHDLSPSSWLHVETTGKPLFYTYAACGSEDTFTATTCDGLLTKAACEDKKGGPAAHCMWT